MSAPEPATVPVRPPGTITYLQLRLPAADCLATEELARELFPTLATASA